MYEKVIEAYKAGNIQLTVARGSSWVAAHENPFPANSKEHALFFTAQRNYKIWEKRAINMNKAYQNMEKAILELAELGTKNYVFGVIPDETPVEVVEEPAVEIPDVAQDETHVFGVIPDEGIVEAIVDVPVVNAVSSEEVEAAIEKTEEPEEGFFRRRKKKETK